MGNNSMINDIIAEDPEMMESFTSEARGCLVIAEDDLKCLRDNPGESGSERIDRAFRSVHSLKSAAGFLGLDNVSDLALGMERILYLICNKPAGADKEQIDLLLEGMEVLSVMLSAPAESANVSIGPYLQKLDELMKRHNEEK